MKNLQLKIVVLALTLISCGDDGKEDLNVISTWCPIGNDLPIEEGASVTRSLKLIADDIAIEGWLDYTLYESGLISYRGFVEYRGLQDWLCESCSPISRSFKGSYRADPKSLLSSSYFDLNQKHQDFKVLTEVVDYKGELRILNVDTIEEEAEGTIEVDVRDHFIDINYIELNGDVIGVKYMIKAHR